MSHGRKSFRGQGKQTIIITASADADIEEIVARSLVDPGLKQAIKHSLVKELFQNPDSFISTLPM